VSFSRLGTYSIGDVPGIVEIDGAEHYSRAKKTGRGVLLAGLHLGNWELGGFVHNLLHGPISVMTYLSGYEPLDTWMARRRTARGGRTLPRTGSWRLLIRELQQGHDVCMLDDLNPESRRGVFTSMMGLTAFASSVVPRVAAASGAVVVPFAVPWDSTRRKFRLRYDPPMPFTGDIDCDTRKLAAWQDAMIRRFPEQWMMWIHKRWETRPPGDPPLYS
jgi:KDO2-lipid IV(A) lauroyltransferase